MFRTDRSRHLIGLSDGDSVLLTSKVDQGWPTGSTKIRISRMFSQWVFLSVLALAVPSFAWAEDAVSDLAREQSKAEQGDKRGDELFAEFTRLRQAAETGEPQALFDFGAYFYQQQNYASAREWWGKAAAAGMVRAQIQLAMLYRDGDGGPQDKTEAARWFRKAAEQGDAAAQNEMGVLYWRGKGSTRTG